MNTTTNYNLKKPEMSDYALIDDINDNMDILDAELASPKGDLSEAAVGAVEASTASYPIPSAGEKVKVILGKVIKFMTDIKKAVMSFSVSGKTVTFTRADGTTGTFTTQDTTYSLSSTSANGLMRKLPESSQTTRFMRGDGNWGTIYNNLTTTEAGHVLDARQGKALNDKINLIGSTSGAEGTYKTKADGTPGTNTCVWKAPAAGNYLVIIRFQAKSYSADFGGYKMFQVNGTSPRIWDNLGQYADNAPYIFTAALWTYPSAANQTLTPVVLSNKVVTYDVNISAYRIK